MGAESPTGRPESASRSMSSSIAKHVEHLPLQEAVQFRKHLMIQAHRDDDEGGLVAERNVVVFFLMRRISAAISNINQREDVDAYRSNQGMCRALRGS